jgi:hypothetical protein
MTWLWNLNLIRFFDFYLALAFLLSTAVRVRQYQTVLALVRAVPGRWPRLFQLITQHRGIFLTWATFGPALAALVLLLIQFAASNWLWPQAGKPPHGLTVERLVEHWLALPFVALCAAAMLAVDIYGIITVNEVPRNEMEKYFDQAEYWLRPWTAPVVRVFTLGYVNPRKMVAAEVETALLSASQLLNSTLWWVALQSGLRIAYGLALWLTFALT